jgi:hypothetical protein
MISPLKIVHFVFVGLDMAIFLASQLSDTSLLSKLLPSFKSDNLALGRSVGYLFLAFAVVRLHGAMHLNEKGAYRASLWSWIIEFGLHVREVQLGAMSINDAAPVLALTAGMTVWLTATYKHYLYPEKEAKKST